ncbi:MAG: hypothetical protein OXU27_06140 [Candidatus Poribacteria bacterium]|nr:hypothetical protein [Candidatus Poribacteria bacterium]MDD9973566.1 hypothetical protein [Candidatus Poribacteria bacterium]
MVNAQKVIYSDQEIEEFVQERKILPDDWYSRLIRRNKEKGELTVIGDKGNEFRIIVRPDDLVPLDFSVILVVVTKSNPNFKLRRYNGRTSGHRNRIEKERIEGFHIHYATERYQRRGLKEEAYALPTDRYNSYEGALRCLIKDANFVEPL